MFRFCPDLGVGVGLRPTHYSSFFDSKPSTVSWVEVVSENFMDSPGHVRPRSIGMLERVRAQIPVVLHGVSLSIGSADDLDREYLARLKDLIARVEPSWVSDHLCWTGVDGQNLHDLLPLPYTEEAIVHVAEKILKTQDFLGRRILIENLSSYVELEHSEMTEWEFLTAVAETADCGILLDVNNIYVSSVNHGFDPIVYLRNIPHHRVGQIHLAGHTNNGTYLVDTHDEPVCEQVWDLYRWVVRNLPPVSVMVERDDNIPEWAELEKELLFAAEIRKESNEIRSLTNLAKTFPASAHV